jgi:O-antigen/teichoic acid export membrane protein
MKKYLKRLASSLGAYQVSNVVAKLIGVVMLPVYTHYISTSGYGTIELLANGVILISIIVRFGMIEAFLRFYYSDEDPERRNALVRRTAVFMLVATTVVSVLMLAFAAPLSRIALGAHDAGIFRIAVLGLWSFTNLEYAYAVLRVDERLRAYATTSVINVLLTVAVVVTLVVGLHLGARGYLLGNYGVSTVILIGLWWTLRHRLARRGGMGESMRALMRFGLPTVPAEASAYLLSIVDRAYLYHDRSPAAYYGGYRALPWVALGWALYGLWVIFLTIAGRAKATRRNFPAAIAGLAVNVGLLLVLVPHFGIAGAGIALAGAYVVMLAVIFLLTRNEFHVDFEWLRLGRLTVVMGGIAVAGDLLLPTHGAVGFGLRFAAVLIIGPVLVLVGFVHPAELRQARTLAGRIRRGRALAARGDD